MTIKCFISFSFCDRIRRIIAECQFTTVLLWNFTEILVYFFKIIPTRFHTSFEKYSKISRSWITNHMRFMSVYCYSISTEHFWSKSCLRFNWELAVILSLGFVHYTMCSPGTIHVFLVLPPYSILFSIYLFI